MDFVNLTFPIFLSVVFGVYWFLLSQRLRMQNVWLLMASYVFYGWWDWRFLLLIMLTSASTYFSAIQMERNRRQATLLLWSNISINLAILFIFKYLNFFGENLSRLFSLFGWNLDWVTLDILLPVGISFYTFQAIGYTVDVYRRQIAPCRDIVAFFTFIAYFPQLVAGPIERASQLLPQIQSKREWNYPQSVRGMRLILLGVVKKVCVSDTLAIYSDRIFDSPSIDAMHVVLGSILFSMVIYFDFSAYSEIAKGVSSLLGINLMKNFNLPYFSRNVVEFWSRWHISLMQWFRDYIYIPLGGSRHGTWTTIRNVFIIFLISGLWHGASWNFVFWGLYWAIVYIIAKFLFSCGKVKRPIVFADFPSMVVTSAIVFFGFYIFRCSSMVQILDGFKGLWLFVPLVSAIWLVASLMVRYPKTVVSTLIVMSITALFVILRVHYELLFKLWWLLPFMLVTGIEWKGRGEELTVDCLPQGRVARWSVYYLAMILIILSEPVDMKFIYFQF